ncbi:HD domain-containing protein [Thermosulfurimonas marina]|uniref:[protein-PII] uridylyltransferase family protein n=1 Tax=Thermosulfurimonas marina TaxID=2047767 RepID=UPI00144A649D|nr:HD domain-containing protein [Thermosulfurimonas marina]
MLTEGHSEKGSRERCFYFDKFVRGLWEPLFRENPESRERVALVALGGYGEGYLCAGSDVDLLFLHAGLSEGTLASFVERLIYPLWDYHFEVSYRIFTPEEALRFALEEPTFLTALFSARLVYGSEALFAELLRGLRKLVSGRAKELYLRLKKYREARLARLGEEVYFLEPHLKEGPGGLRDFQFLIWAGRIVFGLEGLEDFVRTGLLTPEEEREISGAVSFIRRVRETLHRFCERKEDRLFMEYQPEIARRLGYPPDRRGTETFMTELFRAFSTLKEAVEDLMETVEELFFPEASPKIRFEVPSPTGAFLRRIFEIQAHEGRPLDRHLKKYLRGRFFCPEELEELRKAFPSLLTEPYSLLMLRSLRTTEVLYQILPEFRPLQGKVQYDLYHLYALDEHLFLTVEALHRLRSERPDLWKELPGGLPKELFFAALLHDVAKGQPGHAEVGAQRVREIAPRFGFSGQALEEVVFLVRHHLLLMDTALRRDLEEEKVVEEVALKVKTPSRLASLYLLTLADARATGPRAFTSWKAELLEDLYQKVRKLLQARKGTPDLAQKRKALLKEISPLLAESVPLPQLEHYDLPTLKRICLLVKSFLSSERAFLAEISPRPEGYSLFVVCPDRPGLLADLCGSLLAAGFRLRRVRAFTWPQGLAVDEFVVEPFWPGANLEEWKGLLARIFDQEVDLASLLSHKSESIWKLGPKIKWESPSEIQIDQESSPFYTILEIYTAEAPFLLYEIATTITHHGLTIGKALVSEKEDRAAFILYLQTKEGEKLSAQEAEELRQKIQNQLKEVRS